jgi:hypothetical protein
MQKWDKAPTRPWQHIAADFVGMPKTKNPVSQEAMNQILLNISGCGSFFQTHNTDTCEEELEHETSLSCKGFFSIFGIPETMSNNEGAQPRS